jgi:hypothetical protein
VDLRTLLLMTATFGMALVGRTAGTAAPSVTTCEAASPFDREPDDRALQTCLDNYDWVLLKPASLPGYVGYLSGNTLRIRRPGALLSSAANPERAAKSGLYVGRTTLDGITYVPKDWYEILVDLRMAAVSMASSPDENQAARDGADVLNNWKAYCLGGSDLNPRYRARGSVRIIGL